MTDQDDPYLWLEDIESEAALAWVRAQNERATTVLEADPRYKRFNDQALAILHATDKVPWAAFSKGDLVSNTWQDETHVRGLWRRTMLDSYRTESPEWETILDYDALAAAEGRNWVNHGGVSRMPDLDKTLLFLSDGGKDAFVVREFDRLKRRFVPEGFNAPEGKQSVSWLDDDTVLIARDWGDGAMTRSGYPYIVKRWTRGQALDEAVEVFRGMPDDMSASAGVLRSDDLSRIDAVLGTRQLNFYDKETYLLSDGQPPELLPVPRKFGLSGYLKGQVIFSVDDPWPEQSLLAGDLASFSLQAFKDMGRVESQLIFRPGQRQSLSGTSSTRDVLLLGIMDNVRSEVKVVRFEDGKWAISDLPLAKNASIDVSSTSFDANKVMISVTDYLTPTTLLLTDLDRPGIPEFETLKQAPARFDASNLVSEQLEAVSRDGTRIPYFVVRPRDFKYDGSAPTQLYGYGGFQIPITPGYDSITGKLWLENGGVYVAANIRGGGEFGPSWHQAALREKRQTAFDDFFAVSEDLIARGITSPARLGIKGGSNGGLLMGAALTQRPDLYNAIAIHVPLLDMVRYTVMGGAGASWVGEYGDPEVPEEKAFIEKYSPYQNVRPGQPYPEVLVMTSTKDDRVHPGHARKMAARLIEQGYPVLYYENIDGGHGGAANLIESARKSAIEFTYMARRLMDLGAG